MPQPSSPHDPSTVVRRATGADWAALRAIRLEALSDSPDAYGTTYEMAWGYGDDQWRSMVEELFYVCAMRDDVVVGMAAGGENDDYPGTVWLYGLYVTPAQRGTGVADRLVEYVREYARQRDADALYLFVTTTMTRAVAFYRRLGFTPTGETRTMKRNASLELCMMRCSLETWRVEPVAASDLHALRRDVLRGGRRDVSVSEDRDNDESTLNLAGYLGDRIVACASFYRSSTRDGASLSTYQLRFMAVDPHYQRRGYGERVIDEGVRRLTREGAQLFWANARDSALGFYARTGWSVLDGSQHLSVATNLAHTVVVMWLQPR